MAIFTENSALVNMNAKALIKAKLVLTMALRKKKIERAFHGW